MSMHTHHRGSQIQVEAGIMMAQHSHCTPKTAGPEKPEAALAGAAVTVVTRADVDGTSDIADVRPRPSRTTSDGQSWPRKKKRENE